VSFTSRRKEERKEKKKERKKREKEKKEKWTHVLVDREWWPPVLRRYYFAYACLLPLCSDALNVFEGVQELFLSRVEDGRS